MINIFQCRIMSISDLLSAPYGCCWLELPLTKQRQLVSISGPILDAVLWVVTQTQQQRAKHRRLNSHPDPPCHLRVILMTNPARDTQASIISSLVIKWVYCRH
ncbi:unnamed protein product [Urochloa humidicola]